jgi:rod shape-determining protein MreC
MLRRSLVSPLVRLQTSAERWRSAWADAQRQAAVRDSLALAASDVTALRVENDRLRALLGLGSRLQWGFIPAQALHQAERPGDVVTTLALAAGARAGVTRYSPVVAPDGIVGMVQTVDPTMSLAILYSHPDFRASAMTADGSVSGIVYPHLGSGGQRYLLELRNVLFRSSLKPGTPIVTSGLGGTFPRGIPIGTVLGEVKTTEGWSRTYLVRPEVNPAQVTSVMILLPQRGSQGVGNAWEVPASPDSAARGVAAAGDSLARVAAAQRRAHLDSLRADSIRRATPRVDTAARVRPDTGRGRP